MMDLTSAVRVGNIALVLCLFYLVVFYYKVNVVEFIGEFLTRFLKIVGKRNSRKESLHRRAVTIGKIKEKSKRNKCYKFFNDLIIDLGLKKYAITPTSFVWSVCMLAILFGILFSSLFLSSVYMCLIIIPIVFVILVCVLYTKANVVHDLRTSCIIDSENLICNNIKDGVVSSIKQALDLFPDIVKQDYKNFIDNVELQNYHIKDALLELSNNLGSISEEFIKKLILFALEEEHGMAESFRDVVEVNNTKTKLRIEMKRKFQQLTNTFTQCTLLVGVVFLGSLVVYPNIKHFYLQTAIGNFILCLDVVLVLSVFMYMTYLRARDLT